MNRNLKKIMAIVLAGAMVLGMSATVFAATNGATTDAKGEEGAATTTATSINIPKSVVVENPVANITVAYPTMTFNYTVAPKTPATGADVTDKDGDVGEVKAGVAGGLTLGNSGVVTIPTGTVLLNKNGQEIVTGNLTVSVDLTKFTVPGIYRYEITDTTTDAALTAPGVVRSASLDKAFVFDVYITANNDGVLGVAGYVLTDEEVTHINGETDKDSGFDNVKINTTNIPDTPGQDPTRKLDDTNPAALDGNDFYYTYNATLAKKVTGPMGDTANDFQFALAVTNTANSQTLNYYVDARATKGAQWTASTSNTFTANGTAAYIKNGETVTIYGLNPYATVNYTETNNTNSTYKVTVTENTKNISGKGTGGNNGEAVAKAGTMAAYDAAQTVVTYAAAAKAADKDAKTIQFENYLAEVSPTGLVLRFAPYIMMMAAAFLLVGFTRRRRVED